MTWLPIPLAAVVSVISGSVSVSLILDQCALYELVHICLFH